MGWLEGWPENFGILGREKVFGGKIHGGISPLRWRIGVPVASRGSKRVYNRGTMGRLRETFYIQTNAKVKVKSKEKVGWLGWGQYVWAFRKGPTFQILVLSIAPPPFC